MQDRSLVKITEVGTPVPPTLARIGLVARQAARQHALRMYQDTLSANTLKRHHGDLEVFSHYLHAAG
jgi:hypothetical protein